jgi:hypothetical protein
MPKLYAVGAITRRYDLKRIGEKVIYAADLPYCWDYTSKRERILDYPLGAFIAIAQLVDCLSVDGNGFERIYYRAYPDAGNDQTRQDREFALGDFTPGRYGWVLADVQPLLKPVGCRGHQRLWTPPLHWVRGVLPEPWRARLADRQANHIAGGQQ